MFDWISSEKAPFLLTLLLGILTWQAGQFVSEARQGKMLIYSVGHDAPGANQYKARKTLHIVNPSRKESVGPFHFGLHCAGDRPCLTGRGHTSVKDPMAPSEATRNATKAFSVLQTTLPPGGEVWLVAEAADQKSVVKPVFFSEEKNARVSEGSTMEARLISNWLGFLTWGIILNLLALLGWAVVSIRQKRKG